MSEASDDFFERATGVGPYPPRAWPGREGPAGRTQERVRAEALAVSRHWGIAMTVSPSRRKSSSNAKQGMRSSSVVTTTNEIASQKDRR